MFAPPARRTLVGHSSRRRRVRPTPACGRANNEKLGAVAARAETERVLREVGAGQHGVAARTQLLARGIAANAIDRMVRTGRSAPDEPGRLEMSPIPA
jgi:hypothetical protein